MLSGSSALYNEANKQIVTPKLKVELRQNSYGVSWIGSSMASDKWSRGKAINWKGLMIIENDVYNSAGTTRISTTPVFDSYLDLGDTLAAYGMVGASNTAVMRYYSNNGTSWYNGMTLWHGTSIIDALQVTTEDVMYYKERVGLTTTTDFYTRQYRASVIKSRVNDGATWNANSIDSEVSWLSGYLTEQILNGVRKGDFDYLFYPFGSSNVFTKIPGGVESGYDIRSIQSDGKSLFYKKRLVQKLDSHSGVLTLSNSLAVGPSNYYLGLRIRINSYAQDIKSVGSGVTLITPHSYGTMYMKSKDLIDWTFPIVTGFKFQSDEWFMNVLGSTEYELRIVTALEEFDSKREFLDIYKGSSTIDLSDNILAYNNKDNERISLKLGNMK